MYRLSLVLILALSVTFGLLLSCGGEDGGSSSGSASKETARVTGTVENLILASNVKHHKTVAMKLREILTIVAEANAQDGDLCGIFVEAIQNGEVVATAETNCDGQFEMNEVPSGPTIFRFTNDLLTDELELNVPAGGTLDMKVSLDDDEATEVSLNEINITTGPVSCQEGAINIGSDDINELNIVGNGDDCVSVEDGCDVSIIAENVNLLECNVCVNAQNGAFVSVTATEDFDCNADEVGINSGGDSDVILSGDKCTIESGDFQIVEEEGGDVNTENCEDVDLEGPGEEDGGEDGEGDGEEGNQEDDGENNLVCEYDCDGNNCELFCTENIPGDCVDICQDSENISSCIQECNDIECGEPDCDEICVQQGEPICEVIEDEVCEEVCEGECEEECVEFEKEEVLNGDCFENCLASVCEGLEGEDRAACLDEHEGPCANECTELVETDNCIEFEVVGCECDEICEVQQFEICEENCVREGITCRFECEEIEI